ncbi:MAG: hypothetical protein ACQESH_02225 [Campylobacterota bacterium]
MAQEQNQDPKEQTQEPQEEIIVEEGESAADAQIQQQNKDDKDAKAKKKKIILFSLIGGGFVVIAGLVLLVVALSKDKSQFQEFETDPIVENVTQDKEVLQSRLEDMVSKANLLYEEGKKAEALKLYDHIANFSKSISYYNLGVSQMKSRDFKDAIKSFEKAVQNQEHRTISALNAAVSALHLENEKLFNHYIDLAYAYLGYESDSKLYPYLYATINFYKNDMYEALAATSLEKTPYYGSDYSLIGAYANLEFRSFYAAIEHLQNVASDRKEFLLGLSYANVNEYDLAHKHFAKAAEYGLYPKRLPLAHALVDLKRQEFKAAAEKIDTLRESYSDEQIADTYTIKVKLDQKLYDANRFQKEFVSKFKNNKKFSYQLLFYYAPYKVFDANEAISLIQKGSSTLFIDEVSNNTSRYLAKSGAVSEVNMQLSRAIRLALDKKILQANTLLKQLLQEYENHSIVHYNLALTYAQMDNFVKAHEHFTRSYHLDASNFLSGIFSLMSAQLIQKDVKKLHSIIVEDLRLEKSNETTKFYEALIEMMGDNMSAMISWSEEDTQRTPLHVSFQIATYLQHDNQKELLKYTNRLQNVTQKDLMSQLLHLYAQNYKLPMKQFASRVQTYFINNIMPEKEIYHGAKLPMNSYIDFMNLAGDLFTLQQRLNEAMLFSEDPRGIMYALAKVQILLKDYEHAYTLMNELIDKHKMKDSATMFLGAVASVAADHHANATVLLRLATMEDANNYESRYGLGLLYQEAKNLEAAGIQYGLIDGIDLTPKYFDFEVTDKQVIRSGT